MKIVRNNLGIKCIRGLMMSRLHRVSVLTLGPQQGPQSPSPGGTLHSREGSWEWGEMGKLWGRVWDCGGGEKIGANLGEIENETHATGPWQVPGEPTIHSTVGGGIIPYQGLVVSGL